MAIYFASDVHLGLEYRNQNSHVIEHKFVEWLRSIERDCHELHLVGDIFDFWFEWKRVVPKGFVRTLGQLASMSDNGIKIFIYVGNHDLWQKEYFEQELGARVIHKPYTATLQGKKILIAHGDNLGKRDLMGRTLSATFRNQTAQWLFSKFVHPNISIKFGKNWSSSSRHKREDVTHQFAGEKENLVHYARSHKGYDYYIFGHLHTPIIYELDKDSKLIILGQWIVCPTYAKMENGIIELIELQ